MIEIASLIVVAGIAGLIILPVVVRVRVNKTDSVAQLVLQAEVSVFAGVIGVTVTGPKEWKCNPTMFSHIFPMYFLMRRRKTNPPTESKTTFKKTGLKSKTESNPAKKPETSLRKKLSKLNALWSLTGKSLFQLISALPFGVDLRKLCVRANIGLGDPAKTGQLYGVIQCLGLEKFEHTTTKRLHICIEPDFREHIYCGRIEICIHLFLSYFLAVLVRCGLQVAGRWIIARILTATSHIYHHWQRVYKWQAQNEE